MSRRDPGGARGTEAAAVGGVGKVPDVKVQVGLESHDRPIDRNHLAVLGALVPKAVKRTGRPASEVAGRAVLNEKLATGGAVVRGLVEVPGLRAQAGQSDVLLHGAETRRGGRLDGGSCAVLAGGIPQQQAWVCASFPECSTTPPSLDQDRLRRLGAAHLGKWQPYQGETTARAPQRWRRQLPPPDQGAAGELGHGTPVPLASVMGPPGWVDECHKCGFARGSGSEPRRLRHGRQTRQVVR